MVHHEVIVIDLLASNALAYVMTCYLLMLRSAERGSQTPLYVCLSDSLSGETGKLYSNLKEIDIDPKAEDALVAKRLMAVDKYWAGLVKSKDELIGEMAVNNKVQ